MWTNGTHVTNASHYKTWPDAASTSYYPTAWYAEYPRAECLPTPCAPCYTNINTKLHSFPYPIIEEPLVVSIIPYVTVMPNGSRITSYLTSTQRSSLGLNAIDPTIELYETFTWTESDFVMTYPTTYIDLWNFGANVRPATPSFEPSRSASPACANMDAVSYIPLSSPVSTIWPLPTTEPTNNSSSRDTLPSDMMVYLDGQPIIQNVFHGISISSCSTVRQIQTAPCYDIVTFTATLCTTIENAAAAATVNSTQCTTTIETATQPRFWNNQESRGGSKDVSRKSAQLLTYVTGEPVYAPTPSTQTTVAPADLPLSEARIAAVPGSTWDDSHGLPTETQDAAATIDTFASKARVLDESDGAALSDVLEQIPAISVSRALQQGSRTTSTEHRLGSPMLPTTSPELEHMDVVETVLAIQEVASRLQTPHQRPQEIDPRPAKIEFNDFEPTNTGFTKKDDSKDVPPPRAKQNGHFGMMMSSNVVSTTFGPPSQEHDRDTPMYLETAVATNSALQSPGTRQPFSTDPVPPSSTAQTQTLAPGSTVSLGGAHLSVFPDASGLAFSDGSTLRLKDGEMAEITFPDGLALRISRSGTVYLLDTPTADVPPQVTRTSSNGALDPVRTTGQSAGGDVSFLHGGIQVSVSTATDGPADHVVGGVSTGAAMVCLSDVRGLVAGVLLLVFVWLIVE